MNAPRPLSFWNNVRDALHPPFLHVAHFERVLGTALELQIRAGNRAQAMRAEAALLAEIDRLELIFSRFLPQSELNRWLAATGQAVIVSPELGQVLQQAQLWQTLSGGAFHPATEALSELWKRAEASGELPEVRSVLEQMQRPLYSVQEESGRWTATRLTDLPLGFNAFAKGFIADQAAVAAYATTGVRQVLVNIGGDLRVLGPQAVQVDIESPFTVADNAAPIASVLVQGQGTQGQQAQGQGVATSGQSRRGFRLGGAWYSHVLDPRTGQPAGRVLSASVLAPDSASADVLATVFSILDPPESLTLADRLPGVACLLVTDDRRVHCNALWALQQVGHIHLPLDPSPFGTTPFDTNRGTP